ncbi:hypothetical protein ACFL28_03010, partial [Candidatus Omnitrophota bacterium]
MKKYRRFIVLLIVLVFMTMGALWAKDQYAVPILMYHRIDDGADLSKLSVSPESFRNQMQFLKKHNYNVVDLASLADLVKRDRLPYKTISITFDDGYEN